MFRIWPQRRPYILRKMGGGNVLLKLPIITDCLGVMSLRTGCLVIAGFMMVSLVSRGSENRRACMCLRKEE